MNAGAATPPPSDALRRSAVEPDPGGGEGLAARASVRLMGRVLWDARALWWRFGVLLLLTALNVLPIVILPFPLKVVLDHAVSDTPIGGQINPYPPGIAQWVAHLEGASRAQIALEAGIFMWLLLLLVGASNQNRADASSNLAQGTDAATTSENEANLARSESGGLLGWIEYRFQLDLSQRLNHALRSRVFRRIQRLPMAYFDQQRIGDAIFRVLHDTTAVSGLCYRLLTTPILAPLHILLASYMLLLTYGASAPEVMWIGLASLPISLLATVPFTGVVRRRALETRTTGAATTAAIEEGMTNVLAVQSLGTGAREREKVADASWAAFSSVRRYVLWRALILVAGLGIGGSVLVWVFYVLTDRLFANQLSFGDLGAITFFYLQIVGSGRSISTLWVDLQGYAATLGRAYRVLDLPTERDPAGAVVLPQLRDTLRFEGVGFRYPDGTRALAGVDLTLRRGQLIGLVGPAGAGKTTLAQLIPRFLSPTEGRVSIDGRDLEGVTLDSLRSQVSFVFQETTLLDASVVENLRIGMPEAPLDEVRRAAEIAGAHDFIERLPEGYDTQLGRDGGALSVGQRQRIAIARALVRRAPVLILDEPTSAQDPETEQRVLTALREASRSALVIVIAHRLSTIRAADQILYLADGTLQESGSHEALMRRSGGLYRRFVDLQSRGAA